MNKIKIIILIIIIALVGFSYFEYFKQTSKKVIITKEDFTITVNGKDYNVIVGKPPQKSEKYSLVIYHHGGGYKTLEPFELRKLSQIIAKEGFLVWIPERTPMTSLLGEGWQTFEEARYVSKEILNIALNHPEVDKNNINVIGFALSAGAVVEENIYSPNVRSISLLGFGAPITEAVLYNTFNDLVEKEIDYSKVSPKIFIMVSKEDTSADTKLAEIFRQKLVEAGKVVDCIEYPEGNHLRMVGDKDYLVDLIKYLEGEEIKTTDIIETNKYILEMRRKSREGGYW